MDSPAASPELLAWCSAGGLRCHGVKAAFVAEGWRGVVAVRDIAAGMCVLRVPRRLLMCVESARRDPEMQAALEQADPQHLLSSEQVLAAHLLHEAAKGPASFWHPYIRSLPPSYTTAACLSEAEVAALQAPTAVQAARAAAAAAHEQHCSARALLRSLRLEPKWRSAAAWRWAASTISSRAMHMPADPAGALAPLADFHNFRPPPFPVTPTLSSLVAGASALLTERRAPTPAAPDPTLAAGAPAAADKGVVSSSSQAAAVQQQAGAAGAGEMDILSGDGHFDEATNEYLIHTHTDIAAGEQVFLCYGRYTNLELLIHYGFVLPSNPHDTAVLQPCSLPPAVRQQLGVPDSSTHHTPEQQMAAHLHATGAPCWELLRALRLGCASSAERKSLAYLALQHCPISTVSEQLAFKALRGACEATLAAFPPTITADEQQLAALGALIAEPAEQEAAAAGQQGAAEQAPQQAGQQQGEGHVPGPVKVSSSGVNGSCAQQQERLRVVLGWRLAQKSILHKGVALCDAVLAALEAAAPTAPDTGRQIAAMHRATPRW